MGVPQNPSQHSAPGRPWEWIGVITSVCHANERYIFKGIRRYRVWPTCFGENTLLSPEKRGGASSQSQRQGGVRAGAGAFLAVSAWARRTAPCFPGRTLFEVAGVFLSSRWRPMPGSEAILSPLFIRLARHNTYLLKTYLSWLMTWCFSL